jgi:hypothetical protein
MRRERARQAECLPHHRKCGSLLINRLESALFAE